MVTNRAPGDSFQCRAAELLNLSTGLIFELEMRLPIGASKLHAFDLATADRRYVGECKAFTWTASGNVPSAKNTTLREAAQYLSALPPGTKKFIVMARSTRRDGDEPLADHFCRLNDYYLLADVTVVEICETTNSIRFVRGSLP